MEPRDPVKYEENKGRIQGMLILLDRYLPKEQIPYLQEFIDHDEAGLALDRMLSAIIERNEPIPDDLVHQFESMANLMYPGKDAQGRLARLRALGK